MKYYLIVLFIFFSSCNSINKEPKTEITNVVLSDPGNQMLHPCHWIFKVEQNAPGEATLVSIAKIDSGWHLYSQHMAGETPLTLEFNYEASPDYKLEGKTEEGPSKKEHDPYLKMDIIYFETEAVFRQKVKLLSKKDFTIAGTVRNTTCLTQCVTVEDDLKFDVNAE